MDRRFHVCCLPRQRASGLRELHLPRSNRIDESRCEDGVRPTSIGPADPVEESRVATAQPEPDLVAGLARVRALQTELDAAIVRRTAAAERELDARDRFARAAAELDRHAADLTVADAEVQVRERQLAELVQLVGARQGTSPARPALPPFPPRDAARDEPNEPAAAPAPPVRVPRRRAVVGRFPRSTWLALYTVAIIGPLVVARMTGPPSRSFAAELGSSLGIVALSLLALQLVLPARLRLLAPLGADVAVRLHRRLADVTVALIVAHVAIVVLAKPGRFRLLGVVGEPWRAQAAVGSVVMLATLYATAALRRRLRMSYARWRGLHTVLGAAALLLATAHTIGVGRYIGRGIAVPTLAGLIVAALGAIVILRIARPRSLAQRPYVVERVVPERGGATTLELCADGHDGQPFEAGQFAWLKLADGTYGMAEHPFSYSSSAQRPDRPSFTIKAYEGFSSDIAWIVPGTQLIVDGPHGSYRPEFGSHGLLLIAGGIGITPCMSILRTAADRHDRREFVLVFGARTEEDLIFREALEELRSKVDLTLMPVLSDPPEEWDGERGYVDGGVLRRHLRDDLRRWEFFVCGSPMLVAGALRALEEVGIPGERVHAERFVTV